MKVFFGIILLTCMLHNISLAQYSEYVDIKEEAVVQSESASEAKELASQEVLEKIVVKFAGDILGEKKSEANKNLVRSKIVKDSGKFAPILKSEVVNQSGKNFKILVTVKISPQNLREVFEKTGLLTSKFDSGVVLPFISYVDQVRAKTYKWWVNEDLNDEILKNLNRSLTLELRSALKSLNFYTLDPVDWDFKSSLPLQFQKDYFRKEDYQAIESYYKFPLIIKGQVDVAPSARVSTSYKIQVKLDAILASQGKSVAESSRVVETDPGDLQSILQKNTAQIFLEVSQDLKEQLEGALRKGILESSMIQLTLRGDLTFKNIENFKSMLLKSIGGIRYLSERSIQSDKRIYDVDYSGTSQDLTKKITALKFPELAVSGQDVDAKSIEVKISN